MKFLRLTECKNIFLTILIFLAMAVSVFAEEIDQPMVCNGDEIEYFEKEKKVVGSGHVVITYKDTTLTCDKVIVWADKKEAQAEGNVRVVQGDSFFSGETMTYNFEKETGTVVNFKGFTDPWYTKGKTAERTGPDKFVVNSGYVTTCDHENPHYRISARKVLIYPKAKVVIRDATFWIGPVPVLWIPVYAHPLDDDRPRVTIIPGKNSDWGNFLLTAWRYNLDQNNKGYVHMDYRERKDFAYGFDHTYDTQMMGKGTLKTYYMHERAIQRKHIWGENDPEKATIENERFLVELRHKWQIWDDTLATAELYKYRDQNLRKDYFNNSYNNEYEKDTDPRSYLLITKTQPYYNLSILTEKRANRFEDRVERLPEVKLDINNSRVGESQLYYTSEFSVVNLNKKYPRSTDTNPVSEIPIHHNNRSDAYNQLSYAGKVDFLNVTPYVALRETYYDRGLTGHEFGSDSHLRNIFYEGVDISTKFYKIFATKGSPLGMEINNIRHIITPTISYNINHQPNLRENIYVFDSLDSIDRNSAIGFTLENKLQTKRGKNLSSVDFARLGVSTTYDLKHTPGTRFSDYLTELELTPYNWLTITSNATIDSHKRYHHQWLKQTNTNFVVSLKDYLRLGLSHGYTYGELNNITGQLEWRMNPKWKIKAYESFDIQRLRYGYKKMHDLREQQYVISRDLHCWEVDVHYNVLREKGEEILIIFRLKAFPNIPFFYGKNYHEPKRGSQDYSSLR